VSYAPSATILSRLGARRAEGHAVAALNGSGTGNSPAEPRYLIFADPDYGAMTGGSTGATRLQFDVAGLPREHFARLPFAAKEGRLVAELVGADHASLALGDQASEDRLKSERLRDYDRLHFAAHAYVDEEWPLLSSLILAQDDDPVEDGLLTMREIYELDLSADLVVLSSCESAVGRDQRGEGVVALARAFLAAGASSTVVSLWPVDDYSTSEWMRGFYDVLAAGGSKQDALRAARLSLLSGDRPAWRLPYYWAPFIMIGHHL
jgi:CHAT domain-containing protein